MIPMNLCEQCSTKKKDVLRVLCDCSKVKEVWTWLLNGGNHSEFFSLGLQDWISVNAIAKDNHWHIVLLATCWIIWCFRNQEVIENKHTTTHIKLKRIVSLKQDCLTTYCYAKDPHNSREPRFIAWSLLEAGWFKINVDGSFLGNPGRTSAGSLTRNLDGKWVLRLSSYVGWSTNILGELSAIKHGLSLAWNHGYHNIVLQSDSQEALHLLQQSNLENHHYYAIIVDIKQLLSCFTERRLCHSLCVANFWTDHLAKMGAKQQRSLVVWNDPPLGVSNLRLADHVGVTYVRL